MTPTNREKLSAAFWCGWAINTGFHMAYQDFLGLDRFIERARVNWIELHWGVGAAVAAIALVSYLSLRARTE